MQLLRLRDEWPVKGIEIKGSTLDESQTAQVIEVCKRHDVLVNFDAPNMANHNDLLVEKFKKGQADALLAHLTPQHQPPIVAYLQQMSDKIRKMPNQLFLQALTTLELLLETVNETTLYYVQRMPEELGDISWTIDRKDHTLTQMEDMWSNLILPIGENRFAKKHFGTLAGADYSYFHGRYTSSMDNLSPEMARHMEWIKETHGLRPFKEKDRIVDANKLLKEQLDFKDSRDSLGLQLADILATTIRRALNGNLQISGWKEFGRLIVRRENMGSYFSQLGSSRIRMPAHTVYVCHVLEAKAKAMILPD